MATKKQPKKRKSKYEEKLVVNASFGQLIRIAVGKVDEVREEMKKEKNK